ncbi:hypothetical protein GGTG_09910 [Gaeumannomyces tritici R3-111a-1]|uniref:Uncharacterized protein n=1 Tax=Gaeumannomyces tritici (strain R3-111a-1) TaxID=644352 RepID=J3P8S5_GAET3|nr:hypothetical protein GGTG_09910 [Gaeumannomyces tritici R3-111a-1]EJT73059.1 hypothetical protein GGTG_09910 [Gaeumannomyces tritici R3-111a-1]
MGPYSPLDGGEGRSGIPLSPRTPAAMNSTSMPMPPPEPQGYEGSRQPQPQPQPQKYQDEQQRQNESAFTHISRQSSPSTRQFKGFPAKRSSRKKAVMGLLSRWFVIVVLIASIYTVLITFSSLDVLTKTKKRMFNALITGLSIGLALMTVSIMNGVVSDLRWWILSRRHRSAQKVKNILHAHSLSRVTMLILSSKRPSLLAVAVSWLLVALAAQVGLASVNLCFSIDNNEEKALLRDGEVFIPRLDTLDTAAPAGTVLAARQYAAYNLGVVSQSYKTSVNNNSFPEPASMWGSDNPMFFCSIDPPLCNYIFHEINPRSVNNTDRIPITVTTERRLQVNTVCDSFKVVAGGDGTQSIITVQVSATRNLTVALPVRGGLEQSTFITDTRTNCGPRCSYVTVFEASEQESWWYNCTTAVGEVEKATRPEEEVGSEMARLAAAAIALQGFASVTGDTATNQPRSAQLPVQAQVYPAGSFFGEARAGNSQALALIMSRFAIGVIGAAAESNTGILVPGKQPEIGVRLKIEHWNYIHLIFGAVSLGLLVLGITCVFLSHKVVIPKGGPIVEAQVLKSMVKVAIETMANELQGSGMKTEIKGKGKTLWIYRDTYVGNGVYDLYMEETTVLQA